MTHGNGKAKEFENKQRKYSLKENLLLCKASEKTENQAQ